VSFSALTLLVGHQEEHPACKNICQKQGADCLHMVQLMPLLSQKPVILSHLNPDWFPFLVPAYQGCPGKKRPLNGCSSSSTLKQRVFQHIIVQYREFYLTCKDVCTLFWCIEWDRAMSKVFKVLVTDYVGFTNYWYIGSVIHYEP